MDAALFLNLMKSEIRTAVTGIEVSVEISRRRAGFGKCVAYLSKAMIWMEEPIRCGPLVQRVRVSQNIEAGSFDSHMPSLQPLYSYFLFCNAKAEYVPSVFSNFRETKLNSYMIICYYITTSVNIDHTGAL